MLSFSHRQHSNTDNATSKLVPRLIQTSATSDHTQMEFLITLNLHSIDPQPFSEENDNSSKFNTKCWHHMVQLSFLFLWVTMVNITAFLFVTVICRHEFSLYL